MSTVAPSDQRPSTEDGERATDTLGEVVAQVKPKLRGWLHAGMAPLATAGGIVLVALALAAAAFGLVLHNANLAGLAAALLILSLARPAPAAEYT